MGDRLAEFNALSVASATELLRPVCASDAWLQAMTGGRPYRNADELTHRSDEALAVLDWSDVEQALAAHPRIGERVSGADREATWSRQEQSSAATTADAVAAELFDANVAYDAKFGHVFLICATGRTADDILAELTQRLSNDDATERQVVLRELAAIVRLRLAKALQ